MDLYNDFESVPEWNFIPGRGEQICRYMDITSFLYLLTTENFHFAKLEDLWIYDREEGLGCLGVQIDERILQTSRIHRLKCSPGFTTYITPATNRKIWKEYQSGKRDTLIRLGREALKYRPKVFVSSWYMGESSSDFMWRIYGKEQYGIFIRSSTTAIVEALTNSTGNATPPSTLGLGKMIYVANHAEASRYWHPRISFMIKNKRFKDEKEFRLFVIPKKQVPEVNLKINLKKLIKEIRLSPLTPGWAREAITETITPILRKKDLVQLTPPESEIPEKLLNEIENTRH